MIKKPFAGIGTILLLTMLMIVTVVVFTILTVLNVNLQLRFAQQMIKSQQQYYVLDNQAQDHLGVVDHLVRQSDSKARLIAAGYQIIDLQDGSYQILYQVTDNNRVISVILEVVNNQRGSLPIIRQWKLAVK